MLHFHNTVYTHTLNKSHITIVIASLSASLVTTEWSTTGLGTQGLQMLLNTWQAKL